MAAHDHHLLKRVSAAGEAAAVVLFLLLMFVARHSGGKAQDQFSIICERMMHEGGRGGER